MGDFKNLTARQHAHRLTLAVYKQTADFPKHELYGIVSQLRRASVSIEANLAEGTGRKTDPELARFVNIAKGSAAELECLLLISRDLNYLPSQRFDGMSEMIDHVSRLLTRLSASVKATAATAFD